MSDDKDKTELLVEGVVTDATELQDLRNKRSAVLATLAQINGQIREVLHRIESRFDQHPIDEESAIANKQLLLPSAASVSAAAIQQTTEGVAEEVAGLLSRFSPTRSVVRNQIVNFVAQKGGTATTDEIAKLLHCETDKTKLYWVLSNMRREGYLDKLGRGQWRLDRERIEKMHQNGHQDDEDINF